MLNRNNQLVQKSCVNPSHAYHKSTGVPLNDFKILGAVNNIRSLHLANLAAAMSELVVVLFKENLPTLGQPKNAKFWHHHGSLSSWRCYHWPQLCWWVASLHCQTAHMNCAHLRDLVWCGWESQGWDGHRLVVANGLFNSRVYPIHRMVHHY